MKKNYLAAHFRFLILINEERRVIFEDKMHLSSRAKIKCKRSFLSHSWDPCTETNRTNISISATQMWKIEAARTENRKNARSSVGKYKTRDKLNSHFFFHILCVAVFITPILCTIFFWLFAWYCYALFVYSVQTHRLAVTHCWVDRREWLISFVFFFFFVILTDFFLFVFHAVNTHVLTSEPSIIIIIIIVFVESVFRVEATCI